MICFKKYAKVLFFIISLLLFSGCGEKEKESGSRTRTVSSEFQGFWESGILVNEGELKESGIDFEDGPVEFKDSEVEQMLRNMIGKPEGDVLRSELREIHAIYWRHDCYWSNLQSPDGCLPQGGKPWSTRQPRTLEDFALCDNLQWMEFGGIEVPSLEPLGTLTQLETINFEGASVTEEILEDLSLMSALKTLGIGNPGLPGEFGTNWGEITDGSFLLPLADRLTSLDAGGGIRWNTEILAKMTKLEKLNLNDADDLSFLDEMPELKGLWLYCCTAADWSPLGTLRKLEYLGISGNMYMTPTVTMEDIVPLTNLEFLHLAFTNISKQYSRQEIIDALPALKGLDIM